MRATMMLDFEGATVILLLTLVLAAVLVGVMIAASITGW
jgi:hypothetical protein